MKTKLILCLAFVLSGGVLGCSTAAPRSAKTAPPLYSGLTITGSPYQTKPKWLGSRGFFYWSVVQNKKRIYYEPCVGGYDIDLLKEDKKELVFKIIGSFGIPLDLLNGREILKTDAIGKEYRAEIKGDQIIAVSEIK
ncbi:MAG TPA: hypothetical protein VMQ67_05185 [Candidatus Saccharimonadales bacterium]|jgi:hypothetical protein|nr:hypothetical protein [Candidatus Saccharimonadales bacterium]